jgi:hypothetical protein
MKFIGVFGSGGSLGRFNIVAEIGIFLDSTRPSAPETLTFSA